MYTVPVSLCLPRPVPSHLSLSLLFFLRSVPPPRRPAPVPPAAPVPAAPPRVPVGLVVAAAGAAAGAGPAAVQVTPQVPGDGLQVHEVAEAGARALAHLVLAAARLAEV